MIYYVKKAEHSWGPEVPTGSRQQLHSVHVGRQQWWVCLHPPMEGLRCHQKTFRPGSKCKHDFFVVVLKTRTKKSELLKADFKN